MVEGLSEQGGHDLVTAGEVVVESGRTEIGTAGHLTQAELLRPDFEQQLPGGGQYLRPGLHATPISPGERRLVRHQVPLYEHQTFAKTFERFDEHRSYLMIPVGQTPGKTVNALE